jgi:hypothetical protein
LYGAISLMGSWLAWERDAAHNGREVAQHWNKIITAAQLAAEYGEPSECMDWCAIIADCIANSPGTRQALRDLIATDPDIAEAIEDIIEDAARKGKLSLETRTGPLIEGVDCSDGSIFKRIGTLITTLDQTVRDFFQAIEVETNPAERAAKIISAIPALGLLPVDEIISYAEGLSNDAFEEYNGAWSEALYDEMRCDMFCEFKDGCVISLEQATGWYLDRAAISSGLGDPTALMKQVLEFFVAGNVSTNIAVYAAHALALAVIRVGESFLGLDFARLALRIEADANEIDDDYLQLCEECVEEEEDCYDFGDQQHSWLPYPGGFGVRDAGGLAGEYYEPTDKYYFYWYLPPNGWEGNWSEIEFFVNGDADEIDFFVNGVNAFGTERVNQTELKLTEANRPPEMAYPFNSGLGLSIVPRDPSRVVPGSFRVTQICVKVIPG